MNVCNDNRVTTLANYQLFGLVKINHKGMEGNAAVGSGKPGALSSPSSLGLLYTVSTWLNINVKVKLTVY
jgi:hypothetical protein